MTLTLSPASSSQETMAARSEELNRQADVLVSAMASIRRSGGHLARRPVEISNLTGSQLDLVRVILRCPGVSVNQAADELCLAPNTVSTLVRQLIEQNVVVRRADALDRRVARLDLTPRLRRKAAAFRDRRVGTLAEALARLSARDRAHVGDAVALLGHLADELLQAERIDVRDE